MTYEAEDFLEFVKDGGNAWTEAQFTSLANKLIAQGRDPRLVFLGMFRAAALDSAQHSFATHMWYLLAVEMWLEDYMPGFRKKIDLLLEAGIDPRDR